MALQRELYRACHAALPAVSIVVVVLVAVLLSSCTLNPSSSPSAYRPSATYEKAGDGALPALDHGYLYVLAEVTEKNPETDSLEIKVLPWEMDGPFEKSGLAVGSEGTVSCSELVLYPAGIQYGTPIVIACETSDIETFPLTARSIERLDWFEDRLARAVPT